MSSPPSTHNLTPPKSVGTLPSSGASQSGDDTECSGYESSHTTTQGNGSERLTLQRLDNTVVDPDTVKEIVERVQK
jgi:hypothetical protein